MQAPESLTANSIEEWGDRRKVSFLLLIILAGCVWGLVSQATQEKTFIKPAEENAIKALYAIYHANWRWKSLDIDQNAVKDFWTKDVAGLYYYQGHKTGVPIKLIKNEIAIADLKPAYSFYKGHHFENIPYKGYVFKMMYLDENGFYYSLPDNSTGLAFSNPKKFGVIAFPLMNKKLRIFILNEKLDLYYRKGSTIEEIDRWPVAEELEQWKKMEIKQ